MPRRYRGLRYRISVKLRYWTSRYPLASILNRSPRTCWSRLVSWAEFRHPWRELPHYLGGGPQCQVESAMAPDRDCGCWKFVNGCHGKAADPERDAWIARLLAEDERAHEQAGDTP